MSRHARMMIAFVAVGLVSLAIGALGASFIRSPEQVAAEAAPPAPSLLTAPVTSGTLSDTVLAAGVVTSARVVSFAPVPPAGHDAVITALPVAAGETVAPGALLLAVADRPLILLFADVPISRDLARGDTGPDVSRLQDALALAGHASTDRAGEFGRGTQQALSSLYTAVGYAAPKDARGVVALRSELAFAPVGSQGRVVAITTALGSVVDGAAIEVTTAAPVITAKLSILDAEHIQVGAAVDLSGRGIESGAHGTVTRIGTAIKDDDGGMSVTVEVLPDAALAGMLLEGGAVDISIDISSDTEPGLLAPFSAVFARPDGSTGVYLVTNGERILVGIEVLGNGNGLVKFRPLEGDISAGDELYVGIG